MKQPMKLKWQEMSAKTKAQRNPGKNERTMKQMNATKCQENQRTWHERKSTGTWKEMDAKMMSVKGNVGVKPPSSRRIHLHLVAQSLRFQVPSIQSTAWKGFCATECFCQPDRMMNFRHQFGIHASPCSFWLLECHATLTWAANLWMWTAKEEEQT